GCPAGVVGHSPGFQPEGGEVLLRLGREVDHRVDQFEGFLGLAGDLRHAGHPSSGQGAVTTATDQVSRVVRTAIALVTTPQASRTRTDCKPGAEPCASAASKALASAPEGRKSAICANGPGRSSLGRARPPASSRTNQIALASASTTSALSAPPTRTPAAPKANVPSTSSGTASSSPTGVVDQPSSSPATHSTTTCSAMTARVAVIRPPISVQRGRAVAANRLSTP